MVVKRFLALILLAATLVGCEKYDDDRVDKYVENEMKSIDVDRAKEIIAKSGVWKWSAEKTVVYEYDDDGNLIYIHRWGGEPMSGMNFGKFRFGTDTSTYTVDPIDGDQYEQQVEIDWNARTISFSVYKTTYYISGITENYLVLNDDNGIHRVMVVFKFVAD